ncbi:hypothetical protein COV24_00200 [candidate division WWE3 bacterium CG10_big_fil_rev_8_21_14_0_10_32_10]|uniref:Uncharacterized protein n=1 Tax=candidate division WWE3 bacterium CG10_big_fil_rev_8_21_14_0_10_32_10 TaxID=1975090 RepID=A0A2H0RC10_UNCKA|nr:MAG: hypothetical protein COV24_00200 [candidate division WWE3 bacterium CG10_big_fil_rev_8_21_14_0_10_32_10]
MKAKLTFDLPEDKSLYNACSHGLDWYLVALDMDNHLRSRLKSLPDDLTDAYSIIDDIRQQLHVYMADHGVSLEDVE